MVEADLGNQPLQAGPVHQAGRRLPQVLIDHQDPGSRPAQIDGPLRESVLQPGRFRVVENLLRGRLTNIDDREPVQMPRLDLAVKPFPGGVMILADDRWVIP